MRIEIRKEKKRWKWEKEKYSEARSKIVDTSSSRYDTNSIYEKIRKGGDYYAILLWWRQIPQKQKIIINSLTFNFLIYLFHYVIFYFIYFSHQGLLYTENWN